MRVTDYDSISAAGYDVRYREFRHDGIERALVHFLAGARGSAALEVGAGTGHWVERFFGHGLIGLDASANMLARARGRLPRAPLVRADAAVLPFADGSFDRIVTVNAFHHFADKPACLGEARRVLGAGGGFMTIGLDPHAGLDRWWIYDFFPETLNLDLERYSPAATIRGQMSQAGFDGCETAEVEHIVDRMSPDAARTAGLFDRSFTSQFAVLSDEEFAGGLERIEAAERSGESAATRILRSDLRLYATTGWVR